MGQIGQLLIYQQEVQQNLTGNQTLQVTASCQDNSVLVSGGAEVSTVQSGTVAIVGSYPQATGPSGTWVARVQRITLPIFGNPTVGLKAYVVCQQAS